jgi:hypothetical protein
MGEGCPGRAALMSHPRARMPFLAGPLVPDASPLTRVRLMIAGAREIGLRRAAREADTRPAIRRKPSAETASAQVRPPMPTPHQPPASLPNSRRPGAKRCFARRSPARPPTVRSVGVAAKLERRRIAERTARGRADAKAKGIKFGRKPTLTPAPAAGGPRTPRRRRDATQRRPPLQRQSGDDFHG